jgi:hypothetical protein
MENKRMAREPLYMEIKFITNWKINVRGKAVR